MCVLSQISNEALQHLTSHPGPNLWDPLTVPAQGHRLSGVICSVLDWSPSLPFLPHTPGKAPRETERHLPG